MNIQDIEYDSMTRPAPEELLAFYERQSHHSTHDIDKLRLMVENSSTFTAARLNGELIGWARGITDGVWGRLVECKLDPKFQGPACITRTDGRIEHDDKGIARAMAMKVIESLRDVGVERIDAVAYGTEVDFCEELGFRPRRGVTALELVL